MNDQIGELLVKENLLTADQLRQARDDARTKGSRLGAQITQLGYLDENDLTEFVAKAVRRSLHRSGGIRDRRGCHSIGSRGSRKPSTP